MVMRIIGYGVFYLKIHHPILKMRENSILYFKVYSKIIFLSMCLLLLTVIGETTLHPQLLTELSKNLRKGKVSDGKAFELEDPS